MGGKSGGGYDAGPSIEYGEKALNLQKQMYQDSLDRTQPYYDVGTGGLDMLADLLGINGGSVKSRDTVYNNLMPQYTTQQTTGGGNMVVDPEGRVVDMSDRGTFAQWYAENYSPEGADKYTIWDRYNESGELPAGFRDLNPTVTKDVVDFDGLNAAVDEMMANQQTPDNYGSLLKSFSMDDFQADPGYQFRLDEGNKAIERAAAARGSYYDPSTVKALSEYNANTADQTYGDAYNRYNNDQANIFNRLAAVAGIGQTANNSLNSVSANNANAAGNIYGQMGSAAQAAQNANDSQPSMFDTLMGMGMQLGSAYLGNPMAFA